MPIAIKDYSWEENDKMVYITVPLKGVKPNKVDIFSTEEYLKVNFPPYIFECFLNAPVNDQDSAVQIGNGVVLFKLEKLEPSQWTRLQHIDTNDKSKMADRRQVAITRHQERTAEQDSAKKAKKRELDKLAVNEQIRLEQENRQEIEDIKQSERQQATDDLEHWKDEQRQLALKEKEEQLAQQAEMDRVRQAQIEARLAAVDVSDSRKQKEQSQTETKHLPMSSPTQNGTSPDTKLKAPKRIGKKNMFEESAGDRPLRETGNISVSFTPRVFPTAARESTASQEEEWLKKQVETRRIVEVDDAELEEHEKDPVWLRDKGNQFFKAENYQAAINAFTHGIRLSYKMPSLYSNRAACHLKLGNYIKCAEDAGRALELLTPPVPQNAASRVKAHVRRGTAYCELELYAEGLQDYEAALKIDPNSEQLKEDAIRIRNIIQGSGAP